MAKILRDTGLQISVGRYSLCVNDCSHFVLQEYGGDPGDPSIDADTVTEVFRDARLVSLALASAEIPHCFEIYTDHVLPAGYLHYGWPQPEDEILTS